MGHKWQYCSLGGVVRVKISTGEDIAHLGELDEKYWTVLSCPVAGLDMDKQTLAYLDTDNDGKIRVKEVVAASQWLCSALKDKDLLLKGDTELALDMFNEEDEAGAKLKKSARQILDNLGKDGNVITVADASDSTAIFTGTPFNGDGVITAVTAGEDAALKDVLADIIATLGSVSDRSGEPGVTAETIEKFYTLCSDYSQWQAASQGDNAKAVFPYGDATPAAYQACCALKDKMADYFMRCHLLKFDDATAAALEVKVSTAEELTNCPLAKPSVDGVLALDAINPAWEGAVKALLALVPEADLTGAAAAKGGKTSKGSAAAGANAGVSEESWKAFCAKFDAYAAWLGAKKGAEVEGLGLEKVNAILAADKRQALLDLVAQDNEKKEESDSIDLVKKFMTLYRDFAKFLHNYVIFSDFYDRPGRAMFEAGRLFIDQRCCDLCIRVTDMAGHNDMAQLSGMFLIYCRCTSKIRTEVLDIVAVLTAGETGDLRPGKNGIFYDLQGQDWDATITKVVDNPISIANAFWAPYRKFWDFCVGLINKSVADKDAKMMKEMQDKATKSMESKPDATADPAATKTSPFDIAKFAGIFAAIGIAIGYIGAFLTDLAKGIAAASWWQLLLALAAIILVISGPSCFIAWSKLRKRNLGPVLNANGWAINANVLVNIMFGNKLTSVAKYPKMKTPDPYAPKKRRGLKWTLGILAVLAAAFCVWFFVIRDRGEEVVEEVVTETVESVEAAGEAIVEDAEAAQTGAEETAE